MTVAGGPVFHPDPPIGGSRNDRAGDVDPAPGGDPEAMDVIQVDHLRKLYRTTVAVDDVSFSVAEGEIFGLLGPNGAGKTTTAESVSGLRAPDAGEVRVLGRAPARDGAELRELVGVQLQDGALPDRLRVREALELYSTFYRDPADIAELTDRLGLAGVLDTRFGKLSGGERQRLSIALALLRRPRIAILDELTTGLDPQARRTTSSLIEDIRAQGVTILLVTHFMDEAERLCDRVALIDAGRVVALDAPAAVSAGLERVTAVARDGERVVAWRPRSRVRRCGGVRPRPAHAPLAVSPGPSTLCC